MPKPSSDVQDLKRCVARLARLDGRPLSCAEGLALFDTVQPARVVDPRPLLRACEAGAPPVAAVAASLELSSPPLLLTVGLLAAATRDLRVLAGPRAREVWREAPRVFRRYGDLDGARLAAWEASLERVAARLHAAAEPVPWWSRALAAIGLAHGEEARAVVERASARLGDRARARAAAERYLAEHALAFDPRPRGGGELAVSAAEIERDQGTLDDSLHRFGRFALRLDEVAALRGLTLGDAGPPAARLVERGLPVEKVRRLAALGRARDLVELDGEPEVASAYADWACALVPHYAALGLEVPLTPEVFDHLYRSTRREDLGVLAVCLMRHHTRASADSAREALARLDATLGLFQRRPAEAAAILAELNGSTQGAGRAAMPEVAAWLGEDSLLDRYVHLARLAGVPITLSRTLRADFDRAERLAGEQAYLAALPARTPDQDERLRRLVAGEVAPPDPEHTRTRLADRMDDLAAQAYERRLEDVFRGILKQVFRISLPRLTPTWSDAIRFYLAVDKNRELTGTVLRAAAAGVDLARALPKNRAWLDEVAEKMDTAAWLSPRAREVTLGGRVHRLEIERDPVEVLRMGIPFDTCLSLKGGSNAASTVVNAADANKRVIYLRDPDGSIVARKLVAVSEEGGLVGYQLYVAAREHTEAVRAAFQAFCEELAAAARLPLASRGKPRQIHPGFWYDDGAVAFDAGPEEAPVKAYCASLGLPEPADPDDGLVERARLFGALRREDEAGVVAALRELWKGAGVAERAAAWLLDRLDGAALVAEARVCRALSTTAIARAAEKGPIPMLDLAGRVADTSSAAEAVERLLCVPRTPAIGAALVGAATRSLSRSEENDGHGLDHKALDHLPSFMRALPVADALALCDRAEPLFRWLDRHGCPDCAATAEHRLLEAVALAYPSARDPDAVIHCLGSARASLLATRAALRVAARYALAGDVLPTLPPPRLQPLHACPAAQRALAKLRSRVPALDGDPDLLAAVLRQSAGLPREGKLPVPREAPFEALGDLLVQLDLAGVVAPWAGASGPLSAWKPGRWELYHHRRHRTGRREAIVAEALRDPRGEAALDWLVRLGDVAGLSAAARALPPRASGKLSARLGPRARAVAAQVEATRAADPFLAVETFDLDLLGEVLDQGLFLAALARIEERAAGGAGDEATAAVIMARADLPEGVALRAAVALAARGALSAAERAFVAGFLRERTRTSEIQLAPDLAAAFGGDASLRDDLAVALVNLDDFPPTFPAVEAALVGAGHAGEMDTLLPAWLAALSEEGKLRELADLVDEALFRRCAQIIVREGRAAPVLSLYEDLRQPEHAAILLHELGQSPLRASAELAAEMKEMDHWMKNGDNAVLAGWLRACVAGP